MSRDLLPESCMKINENMKASDSCKTQVLDDAVSADPTCQVPRQPMWDSIAPLSASMSARIPASSLWP